MKKWMFLLLLPLFLAGCAASPQAGDHFALNTSLHATLYGAKSGTLSKLWQETDRLEALLSRTAQGDVGRLNAGEALAPAAETQELLSLALQIARDSQGAFDPTLGTVTELWDFSHNPQVPEEALLSASRSLCGWEKLALGETLCLPQGMKLDLGGIAKGYVGDQLCKLLQKEGCSAAVLDLGGNVLTYGNNPRGGPWRIGIQDPADSSALVCTLALEGSWAVVTSGIYERCFTENGVFYHHILNPQTGYPVENSLASVTILCQNSAIADGLSTACFVLGSEKGLALAEAYGAQALFIFRDGQTVETDSFDTFRIKG